MFLTGWTKDKESHQGVCDAFLMTVQWKNMLSWPESEDNSGSFQIVSGPSECFKRCTSSITNFDTYIGFEFTDLKFTRKLLRLECGGRTSGFDPSRSVEKARIQIRSEQLDLICGCSFISSIFYLFIFFKSNDSAGEGRGKYQSGGLAEPPHPKTPLH